MNFINLLYVKSLKFKYIDFEFYSLLYLENCICNLVIKFVDFYVNMYIFVE